MDLKNLQDKLAGRASLEEELESLRIAKSELEKRLRREEQNLEYEQSDVQDMADNTLKKLFYSVLGKQEERLKKEEDEAMEAEEQVGRTQEELKKVAARIKRVEFELREIKRAENDYNRQTEALSARVAELQPLLSEADAMTLQIIQREIDEQKENQDLYERIKEDGKQVLQSIELIWSVLRDAIHYYHHDRYADGRDCFKEAEDLRDLVLIRVNRLQERLDAGVKLENRYCMDPADIDNMIRRAHSYAYGNGRNAALLLPDTPSMILNITGLLNEIEKKSERSKRHRAEMEIKLSELLEKYQMT